MITSINVSFFLTSNMVSGLLNQLQIFWQLHLIELLGFLIILRLHLIYLRLLTGFSMLAFFKNQISEKKMTHKPVKVAAAKTFLSSVYVIGATSFGEYFLFYVITGRHYFFRKINVNSEILLSAMLMLSLKSVLWKNLVFYALSSQ